MFDLKENNRLAGYKLIRLIAETDLSKVYEAKDQSDIRCCLKVIKASRLDDLSSAILRFRSEAAILSQINSRYVVKVLEISNFDDHYFIALEWLEGKTLKDLIGSNQLNILEVISQVCLGLKDVHEKGLLHLDLKSENIIVVKDQANQDLAKIVDFGFAGNQNSAISGLMGTPDYIPPEQSGLVRWPLDVHADLY